MGVRFVTPKSGDAVAVVARSVEAREDDEVAGESGEPAGEDAALAAESADPGTDATIDEAVVDSDAASDEVAGLDTDQESEA
jgi:DNA gyrase subunit A